MCILFMCDYIQLLGIDKLNSSKNINCVDVDIKKVLKRASLQKFIKYVGRI